jgi:rod shape-determining protein MreC
MAPSMDRRPGFSRRAQYGIFTGYVIAVLGVLAGLVLLIVSLIDPGSFSFARGAAAEAARPLGSAGAAARTGSYGLFDGISDYFMAASKNADMRREVDLARANAVKLQSLEDENRRLKQLLGIIDPARSPVTAARLIGSTASSTRRFAILSKGSNDGVRPGMPVRSATGLVGRVLEVGPNTARVLLVTDSENVVPVRRAKDGIPAFVEGSSDGRLVIKLINMGVNPIKPGDVFVTSGSGGLYAPGIPVAVATELTRDGAVGHIVSDPAAAEFVIVDPVFDPAVEAAQAAPSAPSAPAAAP